MSADWDVTAENVAAAIRHGSVRYWSIEGSIAKRKEIIIVSDNYCVE